VEGSSLDNPADDDYDPKGEPWTLETGVRMKARFRVTTAGSLTEAGQRHISFKWHSGTSVQKATVWLGDTGHNEGLTIGEEAGTDTIEKAISEGAWMWVTLDTRNPDYLRGKLWAEATAFGSGEPPVADAVVTTNDDAQEPTNNDFFEMVISAGNMTGADQTVEIDGIWFCGSGSDCKWVQARLGQGDGKTLKYETPQPFKPNSLWFFVDGHHVRTVTDDVNKGTFYSVDGLAAYENAVLVARYLVDENPDGD
jgi:hypothetical protein